MTTRWAMGVCLLALTSCGESARQVQSNGGAHPSGSGGASGSGTGGRAGGSSGAATGGAGAVGGSGAGSGGTSGAGVAGVAGMAGATVDPDVTRRYTWAECGAIGPEPLRYREVTSLDIDATGTFLVTNDVTATAWAVAEPFDQSVPLWSHGGEGAYNTDVSEDGSMVVVSGDLRLVYDARTGDSLPIPQPAVPPITSDLCIFTEYRFSPDGRFVAGKHYDTVVEVFETTGFTLVAELETMGCGQGLRFDGATIMTPEGVFRTSDWTATSPLQPTNGTMGLPPQCLVFLEPRYGVPTTCCGGFDCQTTFEGVTLNGGRHPRFSSEGHWLIAAGTLLHAPSGETRVLDEMASEALFAPNGDVIAGRTDGTIVRYCRIE